jgi:glucose-1-phosphate cytidylyltransferase
MATALREVVGELTVVILCGGRGVRAHPFTEDIPKPLIEIGGRPLLHHLMESFAAYGIRRFVLAAGYQADALRRFAALLDADWDVHVIDSGVDADKGVRIRACEHLLSDPFLVTYGDGIGDVDLLGLLDVHRGHQGVATVTCVPLPCSFATLHIGADGRVIHFVEKPHLSDHPINAGYFVFDHRAFEWWADDLENEVLPGLSARGLLHAYSHDGYWRAMDTPKDVLDLRQQCSDGLRPWLRIRVDQPA